MKKDKRRELKRGYRDVSRGRKWVDRRVKKKKPVAILIWYDGAGNEYHRLAILSTRKIQIGYGHKLKVSVSMK